MSLSDHIVIRRSYLYRTIAWAILLTMAVTGAILLPIARHTMVPSRQEARDDLERKRLELYEEARDYLTKMAEVK